MKTAIIIEDQPLYSSVLKQLIESSTETHVIAEAINAESGHELIHSFDPDLALVDVSLPGKNGICMVEQLKKFELKTKFLFISGYSDQALIIKALRAGASGYIIKDSNANRVIKAIKFVLAGKFFFDTIVREELIEYINEEGFPVKADLITEKSLTEREFQTLRLTAEGLNVKQISDFLGISQKTAENHKSRMMQKLGLQNLHELIKYSVKIGIVNPEEWKC